MDVEDLIDDIVPDLKAANEKFGDQGNEEDEAWELMEHVLGREPDWYEEVAAADARKFRRLVERRKTGEPVAYITGRTEFHDMDLGIKPGMFIPRHTSEFLALQAIRRLHGRKAPVHVDLATGIGPVALSVARSVSEASVWGLDISRSALDQARANARELKLTNVTFKQSDLLDGLPARLHGSIDVITIHPPYVPLSEVKDLPEEVKEHEPEHTLSDGSKDGLGLVRRSIDEGPVWLKAGGWLLMEIVPTETRDVMRMMRQAGFRQVRSTHGSMRYTRVITALY